MAMGQIRIGTSGFDYKEWKPRFYPEEMPQREFLRYYGTRFNTVELNNTFYRMPTPERLEAWIAATPDHFRFALKAPRRITHVERLKAPSDAAGYLLETVQVLQARLGALLFQLPPFFKRDTGRLADFLAALPPGLPAAFEFRHESWFAEETYALLEQNRAALCINDADDLSAPIRLTAPFAYVRLRRSEYSDESLRQWRERISGWARDGLDVYAYIKHEDNPDAPLVAADFARGWETD
jgi:uncharacterized protein YecE (DUF72 family)